MRMVPPDMANTLAGSLMLKVARLPFRPSVTRFVFRVLDEKSFKFDMVENADGVRWKRPRSRNVPPLCVKEANPPELPADLYCFTSTIPPLMVNSPAASSQVMIRPDSRVEK